MILLNYRPDEDKIWLGCSFNEAEYHFLPKMDSNRILDYLHFKKRRNEEGISESLMNTARECYGLNEIPDVFFCVSRDLKECFSYEILYPYSGMWNGYCPFCECDHIWIENPEQLKRLCVTHDGGEPFPNQPEKRKLFFDMDGTLVDFESGIRKVSQNSLAQYDEDKYDDIEGIFSLMDPMPGAIEAARILNEYYDCHILSTSPWDNPTGCSDKMDWIKKYLGDVFYKKVTLTHHKEFLNDGESLLIDDRKTHGADAFGDRLIVFDSKNPDWKGITEKLVKMAREEGVGIHALI